MPARAPPQPISCRARTSPTCAPRIPATPSDPSRQLSNNSTSRKVGKRTTAPCRLPLFSLYPPVIDHTPPSSKRTPNAAKRPTSHHPSTSTSEEQYLPARAAPSLARPRGPEPTAHTSSRGEPPDTARAAPSLPALARTSPPHTTLITLRPLYLASAYLSRPRYPKPGPSSLLVFLLPRRPPAAFAGSSGQPEMTRTCRPPSPPRVGPRYTPP